MDQCGLDDVVPVDLCPGHRFYKQINPNMELS
jgi:hypothetical protein